MLPQSQLLNISSLGSTLHKLLQIDGKTYTMKRDADDFVPVAATNKEVYHFPAAISVKNTSLQTLAPLYPLLNDTKEYHLKRLNKRVRYLPPNYTDFQTHLAC